MGPEDVTAFTASGELPEAPEPLKDAIVRVRYNCTAEQEKALNKADLQKKLLAAGAFYVAEVLPEDVEDVAGESEVTEHEGPTEALERYLKKLEVTPEEAARLMELAAPLIKKADDGRDADKRTGNFAPISIEVKNYRSYTEAEFDFSDVHMATMWASNKVFPKSVRFTLSQRMETAALDVLECLIEANEIFPRSAAETAERLDLQKRALTKCKLLLNPTRHSPRKGLHRHPPLRGTGRKKILDVKNLTASWRKKDAARFSPKG